MSRNGGARRPTEDAPIIGESLDLSDNIQETVQETLDNEKEVKTRRDYRPRLC